MFYISILDLKQKKSKQKTLVLAESRHFSQKKKKKKPTFHLTSKPIPQ